MRLSRRTAARLYRWTARRSSLAAAASPRMWDCCDGARMDFSLEDLDKVRVAAIEAEANRVIAERRRILVRFVSREEFERSDLTRLARNLLPPEIREVRVIEIEGFDAQADGGTHVRSTTEIGRLRITKTENKGKINRRLEIALSGE